MYKAITGETFHDREEYEIVRDLRASTADLLLDSDDNVTTKELNEKDIVDLYFVQKRKHDRRRKTFDQVKSYDLLDEMGRVKLTLPDNMIYSITDRYMTDHCFDPYCESIPRFADYKYDGNGFTDYIPSNFENDDNPTFYDTINELDEETTLHKIMRTVTETPPKVIKIGESIQRNVNMNKQIYDFYVEEMLSNYLKTHDDILTKIFDAIENHKSAVIQADEENAIVAKW